MTSPIVSVEVCTHAPTADEPAGLALAVRIVFHTELDERIPLRHGEGILYAAGSVDERDVIVPRCCARPAFCEPPDGHRFAVCAEAVLEDGSPDPALLGQRLLWTTDDLISFTACMPIPANTLCLLGSCVPIDGETAEKAVRHHARLWAVPPEPGLDRFPLLEDWGDPVLFRRGDTWYLLGTNDATDGVGLLLRAAPTVAGLFAADARASVILPYDPSRHLIQTFWAPELHRIHGEDWILFAVSGEQWGLSAI